METMALIHTIPNLNSFLSNLAEAKRIVYFRKDQVIFSHGDPSDSVFYLETGAVKLTVTSVQGKEAVIAILGSGALFGENALASGSRIRAYQAIALSRVRALRVERDAAMRAVCKNEEACRSLISCLIELTERLEEDVAANILYDSDRRLARALLSLSRLKEADDLGKAVAVNQQTLASMIGTTRQRVNVLLQHFRRTGLVADAARVRPRNVVKPGRGYPTA
jgi:CRP-like cAMP-binding protein